MMNDRTPEPDPANKSHHNSADSAAEPRQSPARRNHRIVIGGLDFFDLLMEQEEQ